MTARGLRTRRFRITPPSITVTITSSPAGRTVTVDGASRTTPYTETWESGSAHTLNVPFRQTAGQTIYTFSRWSDGGTQQRTVRPTADTTYTADFLSSTANSPPRISAFTPQGSSHTVEYPLTSYTFSATGTDPDNNLVRYQWTVNGVTPAFAPLGTGTLSSADGTTEFTRRFNVDFVSFDPGAYEVKITFTDERRGDRIQGLDDNGTGAAVGTGGRAADGGQRGSSHRQFLLGDPGRSTREP